MNNQLSKFIYKIEKKFVNVYRRESAKEQKRTFAECGENVTIGNDCHFDNSHVHVGSNVIINHRCNFMTPIAHVYIGNYVLIAPDVTIVTGNHKVNVIGEEMFYIGNDRKDPENDSDVVIEDDVWIGNHVIILKGVHVGKGSIIGAGAIVTKDIPPYTIHVGVGSIKEKARFTPEEIEEHERLLALKHKNDKF